MERKVTIQDIADMVNVSKSSVSRYLNGGYVSKENTEKIKAVIERTGFQTNFFARRLKTKRSKLIGIVLPRIDSVTVGKMLQGMNSRLAEAGYQGLILTSELSVDTEVANIKSFCQQGVDGIIVVSLAITSRHIGLAQTLERPIFFVGQQHENVHYAKVDDEQAGALMGEYLREKGHRQIVFLGVNERDRAVGVERKRGFIKAVTQGCPDCRVEFVETGFSFQDGYVRGAEVLRHKPQAVVCATDNIGLGFLRYLHECGIQVPEEISVAGFGGYEAGAVAYPALTTVAFDYAWLGRKAAQGILALIEEREMETAPPLLLKLVERESVRDIN